MTNSKWRFPKILIFGIIPAKKECMPRKGMCPSILVRLQSRLFKEFLFKSFMKCVSLEYCAVCIVCILSTRCYITFLTVCTKLFRSKPLQNSNSLAELIKLWNRFLRSLILVNIPQNAQELSSKKATMISSIEICVLQVRTITYLHNSISFSELFNLSVIFAT